MAYQGSLAYDISYDAYKSAYSQALPYEDPVSIPSKTPDPRRSFEVVTGGGLDREARRAVSGAFVLCVRWGLIAVAAFMAISLARIMLTTATVQSLRATASINQQIEAAQNFESSLRVEKSVLSSTTRIARIATQNYGMTLPESYDHITIDISAGE